MLATLLIAALALPVLADAVPLQPRSPLSDAVSTNVGEQGTSLISTGWLGSAKKSNDGLALIARSLFDTYQDPSENYTPFTNNEASPAPGDARAANVAPEVEEAEPTSISSIESTTTTQEEPKSSVATPSAVDVPLPSSDQPKVAEQNWYPYYWDWVRPRAIVPVRKH